MNKRPDFNSFKDKALAKSGVREEYEKLVPAYDVRRKLIALRKEAGMTQEEMATLLHTRKSNISRLERVDSEHSPRLSTIEEYAAAIGYRMKIDFEPISKN